MDDKTCGWTKVYTQTGMLVTLPIPCDTDKSACYENAFAATQAILKAGFLVREVGMEAGEEKEMVAFVVRGESEREGRVTPFVLLYSDSDAYRFSFLKVYLNRPENIAAFEAASGMKLESLPVYVGQDKPERGKNRRVDEQFLIPAQPKFGVIYKPNPKFKKAPATGDDTRTNTEKTARVFVRWENQAASSGQEHDHEPDQKAVPQPARPASSPAAPQQPRPAPAPPASHFSPPAAPAMDTATMAALKTLQDFLDTGPDIPAMYKAVTTEPSLKSISQAGKTTAWGMVVNYAQSKGYVWDGNEKQFRSFF